MPHPQCECNLKKNITKALMSAQEDFDSIEANHINPQFKNKYAKLVDLYNACKKSLRKQGIVISHNCNTHPVTHQQVSKTTLIHIETGETLEDSRFLLPEKPGSQGHGAAETYMKKYALKSLLGTDVGEDDDDGHAEESYRLQVNRFITHINQQGDPHEIFDALFKHYKVSKISEIGLVNMLDASLFVWEFCVNRARAKAQQKAQRVNVDSRIEG